MYSGLTKETSEIQLSSSTPGWQGCTPNIVEIRSLCLRRQRILLSLPDLEKSGMLSCRTAACK